MHSYTTIQGRSHWGAQGGGAISEPNKVQKFHFKHQGYYFYGCSEIIWTRTFTVFTVYATIFGQSMGTFQFF